MIYTCSDPIVAALVAPEGRFTLRQQSDRRFAHFQGHPQTLTALYRHAMAHGEAVATIDNGAPITFKTLFTRAAALSQMLHQRFGITHGSRVAIVMSNRWEWMVSFIAITSLGGIAVLINSRGVAEELNYALVQTRCALAILDDERAHLLAEAASVPPWGQIVLAAGRAVVRPGKDMVFEDIIQGEGQASPAFAEVDPAESATVLFTSGTTGYPKAALHRHGTLTHAVALTALMGVATDQRYAAEFGVQIPPARSSNLSATIIAGPLFHLGGIIPFLRCLYLGTTTIIAGKWHPERILRTIEDHHVTRLSFVPTMFWDLMRSPTAGERNMGQILFMSSGAAAISPALTREIMQRMPKCMLGNTYGSTETMGYVASIAGRAFFANPTSCGSIVPTVEVRLVKDDGSDAAAGEAGEVVVRSPCTMEAYLDDPVATAETLRDGWLYTGDVGMMNDAGLLHIVDRKKNMVISGGENIYCAEVERVLSEHECVLEVLAYGVPDERLGERLAVTVVKAPGAKVSESGIKSYVAGRLALYKVPRDVRFSDAPFARTASGKIDRASFLKSLRPGV